MLPESLDVVCLAVGKKGSMVAVSRLQSMLARHMPIPFRLHCIVDRPQKLPEGVTAIDASGWTPPRPGMRGTTYKLGLYSLPLPPFLYLDTTIVVQKDLGPLLEFAFDRAEELVVLRDWGYDAFNTCVQRIRPNERLAGIPRAYAEGVVYEQKTPGDQDFVTAFIREHKLESEVAIFPAGMIASYKIARSKARKGDAEGFACLERAIIVKFHGAPKMDELLNPWFRLLYLRLLKPKTGRVDATFWVRELRERWR